ncbi:hypothetical protein [Bifidobacterium simiarum]|uniref:hypothetical protein n=1 Tax=Bifidobacterium simiarum TaxID=2045441 RepID=UPI001BDD49CD|nr:hypothetical protein [Bifidobacterium simiarum]MBT1166316.1 hypothetical protein [Bifidobacterium simiarum]
MGVHGRPALRAGAMAEAEQERRDREHEAAMAERRAHPVRHMFAGARRPVPASAPGVRAVAVAGAGR